MALQQSVDLDLKYIKKVERITKLNLSPSDFFSTKYKKEIQFMLAKRYFPDFDLRKTINTVDATQLNRLIADLKRINNTAFINNLHKMENMPGIGPGEATMYFLVNTAYLGGGTSAGLDLFDARGKYEVKGARISTDNVATNFKLGTNVPLVDLIVRLNELREELKLDGSNAEIKGSIIQKIKSEAPIEFKKIEEEYARRAYDTYFKNKNTIFVNNNETPSKAGLIEAMIQVNEDNIEIERVTRSAGSTTIKPKVRLK